MWDHWAYLNLLTLQAVSYLSQISDGSLDNIAFTNTNPGGIKEEPYEDYEYDENYDYGANDFVETEMKPGIPKLKVI